MDRPHNFGNKRDLFLEIPTFLGSKKRLVSDQVKTLALVSVGEYLYDSGDTGQGLWAL